MENSDTKMKYSDLLLYIGNGSVEKIELTSKGDKAYVTLKNSSTEKEVNIPSVDSFMNEINEYLADAHSSDMIKKYKNLQGCLIISEFTINTDGGRCNEHYYIKGE